MKSAITKSLLLIFAALFLCAVCIAQSQTSSTAPTTRFATLYQFLGAADGGSSYVRLVADSTGAMYGTTPNGGTQGLGNIFQMGPPAAGGGTWSYSVLYSFGGASDGVIPESSLTIDVAGNLYGTTYQGGTANLGTVFELLPPLVTGGAWTEKVLYSFQGGNDGRNPYGGVTFDKNGNLYGTTQQGGVYLCTERRLSCGTIYQLTPTGSTWTETVLYQFQGRADGAFPDTALAIDSKGALYGTTTYSGGLNPRYGGVVFQLNPQTGGLWTFATLYDFIGTGQPGFEGDLLLDGRGALYGTSWSGGSSDMGFVYRLKPGSSAGTWTFSNLWSFSGIDGSLPQGGVIRGTKGVLHGTTYSGGDLNKCNFIGCGVVFKLVAGTGDVWTGSVLHQFTGAKDGAAPQGALLRDRNGILYGTTSAGAKGSGTIFKTK